MPRWTIALTIPFALVVTAALVSGQTATTPLTDPAEAARKDLAAIQGKWERSERSGLFSSRRVVKEIEGDKETLTTYDKKGNVVAAHTVVIDVQRGGPVRLFRYSNQKFTAGPQKGRTNAHGGTYVYRVTESTFTEVWDLLAGQERSAIRVLEWTRVRAD